MEIQIKDYIWEEWLKIFGEKAEDELHKIIQKVATRGQGGKMRTTLAITKDHSEFLDSYCFLYSESRIRLISNLITKVPIPEKGSFVKSTSEQLTSMIKEIKDSDVFSALLKAHYGIMNREHFDLIKQRGINAG